MPVLHSLNDTTANRADIWPALPLAEWKETCDTLHMWTQIVGKVRTALTPPVNHWWHVPLYVNARGLTTSAIAYGTGVFEIQFDFVRHNLLILTSTGAVKAVPLMARPVAEFYREFMATLASLGIEVKIWTMPQEVADPIPFDQDEKHASYDPEYVERFWHVLIAASKVLQAFRGRFLGKCSPVHFFWGSFDLAVSRFSGRRAPERPGADLLAREGYSHEVSSAGWWPGGGPVSDAAFYSYIVPEPPGFAGAPVRPATAFYSTELKEFLLMYDDVRRATMPETTLMDFLQSTYEAGATLGGWDREALERRDTPESRAA
jgi:hypothetical protein